MTAETFIAILEAEGAALAESAERAGLDAPVPTCPGWTIRDLLIHLGGVHRWAATHVAEQRREPFPEDYTAPADGLLGWYRERHRDLVATLRAADPAVECWTFLPAGSALEFWSRRQAHETAIHRADAEAALGTSPAWSPWFAADGVDELLTGFLARRPERLAADPSLIVALHATDIDRAWTIRMTPDGLQVTTTGQPDVPRLTGTASDLYLFVWNRIGTETLTAHGDQQVWTLWREKAIVT